MTGIDDKLPPWAQLGMGGLALFAMFYLARDIGIKWMEMDERTTTGMLSTMDKHNDAIIALVTSQSGVLTAVKDREAATSALMAQILQTNLRTTTAVERIADELEKGGN